MKENTFMLRLQRVTVRFRVDSGMTHKLLRWPVALGAADQVSFKGFCRVFDLNMEAQVP